ncbi:MAG: hypothetical protein Fur0032_12210 [Terrimicrobiaceae bacterium]
MPPDHPTRITNYNEPQMISIAAREGPDLRSRAPCLKPVGLGPQGSKAVNHTRRLKASIPRQMPRDRLRFLPPGFPGKVAESLKTD